MKRFIFIVFLNLLIISVCYANATKEKHYTDQVIPPGAQVEETDEHNNPVTYEQADISVLMEKGMSSTLMTEVKDALSYFKPEILQQFNEDGWKIMLVSTVDFSDSDYEGDSDFYPQWTVGFTNYNTKIIQIKDIGVPGHVRLKLLHEMSHYVDKYYDFASYSDDFKALYEKYKDTYIEYEYVGVKETKENEKDIKYASSCEPEFFASAYKDYIYHPDFFEEEYKELFDFFAAMEKEKEMQLIKEEQ